MKAIVGVDAGSTYRPALALCLRLQIPKIKFICVHVVKPPPSFWPALPPLDIPSSDITQWHHGQGEEQVANAKAITCVRGICSEGIVVDGGPAQRLMEVAEVNRAELVVVGTGQKHGAGFVLGSVRRALAIAGRRSMLTACDSNRTGPITAVFATDHSPYANRCLDEILEWKIRGLRRVHIVTAYDPSRGENDDPDAIVRAQIEKESLKVAFKLAAAGCETAIHVVPGDANEVIQDAMKDLDADLLILGAQGHGFVDRLLVGSVALNLLSTGRYPMLMVQPKMPVSATSLNGSRRATIDAIQK
jgi:nucleotide-binding universal stress UspA family protein